MVCLSTHYIHGIGEWPRVEFRARGDIFFVGKCAGPRRADTTTIFSVAIFRGYRKATNPSNTDR